MVLCWAATVSSAAPRLPMGSAILFWTPEQRAAAFPRMEKVFTGTPVRASPRARRLERGRPLPLPSATVDAFMAIQHAAGLIVMQDGRVRLERFAPGYGPATRWASFSLTKSVTSTLVGVAIRQRLIGSLDDPVTAYLPALAGSAYAGVSIRALLAMRSGVGWTEDYTDPAADLARLYLPAPPGAGDRTVAFARTLAKVAPPGTRWHYDTGEADLAGVLIRAVAHRSLARYLSARLWVPAGMADDAFWMTDAAGDPVGGSGLSMTLEDEARFGRLALEGGRGLVPAGWFGEATRDAGGGAEGYGEGWWALPHGRFAALGIFGQAIVADPSSRVVVVIAAAWPTATDAALSAGRTAFVDRAVAASRAAMTE